MRRDWILDVLTDLKVFARANGLPILAEQLDDTMIVAMAEISAKGAEQTGACDDARPEYRSNLGGVRSF